MTPRHLSERNDFALAVRAFEQFTLAEKESAIERFACLRYPSAKDRFFEAVHQTIVELRPDPPVQDPR